MSSNNLVNASSLTGGASGSLDSHDGNDLAGGDAAITITSSVAYLHTLDASGGEAENSPLIVSPDANAGNKRWDLLGMVLASLQLATGAQVTEISTDDTLAGDSDAVLVTEQAIKAYIDNQISAVLGISNFRGYLQRPVFEYKDGDEIYLGTGRYHHQGTAEQIVYWDSQLTFQFGPGGSNAASSSLGTGWQHLYIDDSELSGAVITAARLLNSTTGPTWNAAKQAWMNSNDRCVGSFYADSGTLKKFTHHGDKLIIFDEEVENRPAADLDDTFTAVVLRAPAYVQKILATFESIGTGYSNADGLYRTTGSTGSGHMVTNMAGSATNYAQKNINTLPVYANSSQSIDVKHSVSDQAEMAVLTNGFYLPRGM